MPRFAANLNWMFPEWPFAERFAAAADAGFTAIEILVPYELPADVIARELARHKLAAVLFNTPTGNREAGDRGLAAPRGRRLSQVDRLGRRAAGGRGHRGHAGAHQPPRHPRLLPQ